MPRSARIVVAGYPHHITQRGNYRQVVFRDKDDTDKKQYLHWLNKYSELSHLSVVAYCLMPNHVHFIAIPHRSDSLARTFNTLHMRYSQYVNVTEKRKGHLWQGRFFSCVLDDAHLLTASRYVERNPVAAGLVKNPWQWEWSSAAEHVYGKKGMVNLGDLFAYVTMSRKEWGEYISREDDREEVTDIERHTTAGRPMGDSAFLKIVRDKSGVKIPLLTRGRPKKGAVPF